MLIEKRISATFVAAILAVGLFGLPAEPADAQSRNPQITRTLCNACHADKFASTAAGPHSVLDQEEWREEYDVTLSCIGCHGDVEEHIAAGGQGPVFSFSDETALEQNEVCMGCHRDTRPLFDSSPHGETGLACTSCHSQHESSETAVHLLVEPSGQTVLGDVGSPSALCASCHTDIASAFALNERHRLSEGALECTSCHNPHEPATRSVLGGFKQQACAGCHEDKGGPFVFEHPASRVEGCTGCHSPHGSPNRHLLPTNRVAELCISCHAEIPQFHLGFSPVGGPRFNLDTQCTNCHSQIHGSNFHPRFLR
jgi:DmsE family decaheme c-type cytochrome